MNNLSKRKMSLSYRQLVFCNEYLANGGNCLQAMLTAGYKEKYAYHHNTKMLENVGIKVYLEAKRAQIEQKTEQIAVMNKADCINRFVDIANRAKEKSDLSNENRAIDNVGRIIGAYAEDNAQKVQSVTDIIAIMQQVERD